MFVEVVRLFIVVFGTIAGFTLGRAFQGRGYATATELPSYGGILGCLVGYVAGGAIGRLMDRAAGVVERRSSKVPPAVLFIGAAGALGGGLVGAVAGVFTLLVLPTPIGLSSFGLLVWIAGWFGVRVGVSRAEELLAMAGLSSRPLIRATPYAAQDGYLVDTSAIMDGQLEPLARAGLLDGDLLVPRFVLDELQGLADAADGVRSRRARRGLESLEAMRSSSLARVSVLDDEVPQFAEVDAKLVVLAKRLQARLLTSDGNLAKVAEVQGVVTGNLRQLAAEMGPVRMPGEHLAIELVRAGREPGQGVGYLEDGSMVVVADAAELVGSGEITVAVTSTIPTAVGRMVFARLAPLGESS